MQDCKLPWIVAASTNGGQQASGSHRNTRRWREAKSVSTSPVMPAAVPSGEPPQIPEAAPRTQAPTARYVSAQLTV
jgi:hypothetical protein